MANIQFATVGGYKHKFSHVVVQLNQSHRRFIYAPVNNHWFYFSSIEHVRHSVHCPVVASKVYNTLICW